MSGKELCKFIPCTGCPAIPTRNQPKPPPFNHHRGLIKLSCWRLRAPSKLRAMQLCRSTEHGRFLSQGFTLIASPRTEELTFCNISPSQPGTRSLRWCTAQCHAHATGERRERALLGASSKAKAQSPGKRMYSRLPTLLPPILCGGVHRCRIETRVVAIKT